MKRHRKKFIEILMENKESSNMLIKSPLLDFDQNDMKSNEASAERRVEGNILYLKESHSKKDHELIYKNYCESIVCAHSDSQELAFAYGNRSAFLLHIRKYGDSIKDIDRALQITNSDLYKVKLLCRRVQCLKSLGSFQYQNDLDKAKCFLAKVPGTNKMKKNIINLIHKTEIIIVKENLAVTGESKIKYSNETDMCKNIKVEYHKKYGRYMVAKRDFKPGEIIYTEKFHTSCLNIRKKFTNCHHCLSPCWSLIPCDYCSWAMFCTDYCKNEALENYHKLECYFIPSILFAGEDLLNQNHLPIRLLLMALKEAGNVENLQALLKEIDEEHDSTLIKHLFDQKLQNKFLDAYRLINHEFIDKHQNKGILAVSIGLMKMLSKNNWNLKTVEDLLNNENLIFIGSLFIKTCEIAFYNCHLIRNMSQECDHYDIPGEMHETHYCKAIGTALSFFSSLINHSCIPNISRLFINEQKIMIYAIQPIKKNTQLFDSYRTVFYIRPREFRQEMLKKYRFICDCSACTNNWPVYDFNRFLGITGPTNFVAKLQAELIGKYKKIAQTFRDNMDHQETQDCTQIINDLSNSINDAVKYMTNHCEITCHLYYLLLLAFEKTYGVKSIKFVECINSQ